MVEVITQESGDLWHMINGDSCEVLKEIPDESIGYSVFSPPFSSLFVYSDSDRDLGNSENDEEFFEHFAFIIHDLYRMIKPGRLCSVHCMNLPSTITHNGYIGIRDFRGDIIRAFLKEQWIFHSEVCIWKDPVTAMQRTKAIGLLHKQVVKDSCMSRMGLPDYVCTFRKPGKNPDPVSGEFFRYAGESEGIFTGGNPSIDIWQRYASPVWDDIRQSATLNVTEARSEKDVRHLCPLQIDVIERCLDLWSKEGDTVLSPFAGIGSEGVMSIRNGRKFIGVELKPEYYHVACKNLRNEERDISQPRLFDPAVVTT